MDFLVTGFFSIVCILFVMGLAAYLVGALLDEFFKSNIVVFGGATLAAIGFPVLCYYVGQWVIPG